MTGWRLEARWQNLISFVIIVLDFLLLEVEQKVLWKKVNFKTGFLNFMPKQVTFSLNWQIHSKKGWMVWYLIFSTRQFMFENIVSLAKVRTWEWSKWRTIVNKNILLSLSGRIHTDKAFWHTYCDKKIKKYWDEKIILSHIYQRQTKVYEGKF